MDDVLRLSAADAALVTTIYDPPRSRQPWMLTDILPAGATRYYSLARWALVDALRACDVGAGDRVLVPALICREVLASIHHLGATAAFYPVSPQLCAAFGSSVPGDAKAVLTVNYFGFPQPLDVFRRYCERTGAALIEDNAHGLLSRDDEGRLLGSRGDAAIFSFRKTIAVPGGGALVLNGGRTLPAASTLSPGGSPGVRYRVKQAVRRAAERLGPVASLRSIAAARRLRGAITGHSLPSSPPDAETRIPAAPSPPALIQRPLAVAEPALEAQRRRALFALAGRIVAAVGARPVFPHLPQHVVPYGFPILASPAQVQGLTAHLARHGLPLAQWPDLPLATASSAPEHYRQLLVVPFLW